METTPLSPAQKSALLSLLDDPSPTVRCALLARFTALGADAAPFLHEVARGAHPALARAATSFIHPCNW